MARSKTGKKIGKNKKQPRNNVKRGNEPIRSDSPLTLNFSKNNWLRGVSVKEFTNKLKDEKMFSAYIFEFFNSLIPLLHEHGKEMIKQGGTGSWKHCHQVPPHKTNLVIEIAKEIHGDKVTDVSDGSQLWQFGVKGGIRLIAIHNRDDNYVIPLFIDYHHQIHPSQKHNEISIEKYKFCPAETFK